MTQADEMTWEPLYHCGSPYCRVWPCCVVNARRRLPVDVLIKYAERRARRVVDEAVRRQRGRR